MATSNPEKIKAGVTHGLRFIAMSCARVPETGRMFLAGSDFKVYEADLKAAKFEPKEVGKHDSYVTGMTLAGKTLATCGYDRCVKWWDIESKKEVRSVEAHGKWCRALATSPDNRLVASVADDMVCKVWEAATGKPIHELRGHKEKTPHHFPSMLYAVAFSADGKLLATGDKVGHIVIWDVKTGKERATLEAPGFYTWDGRQRIHSIGGIRSLAFSPDGKSLAIGGTGKIGNIDHLEAKARLEVFDWASGKATHLFEKCKGQGLVNRLYWEPSGKWVLGGGGAGNGFLNFYDLKAKKILKEQDVKFHVHTFAMNDAGDGLWAVGHNSIAAFEIKV
jgi:WD40 repeat protein